MPATILEAGTSELIQKHFALAKKQRSCANFRGNAKKSYFLPQQRYPYVLAWFYLTKLAMFVYTNLLMQISIHSRREIKTSFWRKFERLLLVVHLSYLHEKQLLMKLLFEKQQTYANLLLGLVLANYTVTRCVNPCRPVLKHGEILIQRRVDSRLDKTRPVALKVWSSPIFNEQDPIVKLKASTLQADRRMLTFLVLMGFVRIATLCLQQRVAFTTFVLVKK